MLPSAVDGFMMGMGFLLVLLVIGAVREIIGNGTLFENMHLLFGEAARNWRLDLFGEGYKGFLVAVLPPGAFLVTGLLIAVKNMVDAELKRREDARKAKPVKGSKRVRTTGQIA